MRQLAQTHEPLRELLRFAISEDYFLLREKLGTADRRRRGPQRLELSAPGLLAGLAGSLP